MTRIKRWPNFAQVVRAMIEMARSWSRHPRIVDLALFFKCEQMTRFEELFDFMKAKVRFKPDPRGTEWLRDPLSLLTHGFGDCDDVAVMIAAILLAKRRRDPRYRVRFMFAKRADLGEPTHVFVQGFHPRGGWVNLDPLFTQKPGQLAPALRRNYQFFAADL